MHSRPVVRGFLGKLIVLLVLVTPAAPSAAGAMVSISEPHECGWRAHSCAPTMVVACCCRDHRAWAVAQGPAGLAGPASGAASLTADARSVVPDAAPVSAARLRLRAPAHGFRPPDLSIFLSSLLI